MTRLNSNTLKELGDIFDQMCDNTSGVDNHVLIVNSIIQQLRDCNVHKDSAIEFTELKMIKNEDHINEIYDEGNNLCKYKVSELGNLWVDFSTPHKSFWKDAELHIDELVKKSEERSERETRYPIDETKTVVVDHINKIIYEEKESKQKNKEGIKEAIVGAIPTDITIYDNPNNPKSPRQYEITWESRNSYAPLKMSPMRGDEIHRFLRMNNFILDNKKCKDVVSQLLFKMEFEKKVKVDHGIIGHGIFYNPVDKKLVKRGIEIKSGTNYEENRTAIYFLDEYVKYFEGQEEKLATVLKWGLMSAYSFAIKQMHFKPMKWLYMYGKAGSGKTQGYGFPVLYMYGHPNSTFNNLGGGDVDTPARLGRRLSQTTTPTLINEPGKLFEKNDVTAILKVAVDEENSRSFHEDYTNLICMDAYSPFFITSNHALPNDESLQRRFMILHCSHDENTRESRDEFEKDVLPTQYTKSSLNYFKVFSGYVWKRVSKNPELLSDWKEAIDEILVDFWVECNESFPEWLSGWIEEKTEDNLDDEKRSNIRRLLHETIMSLFTKHYPHMSTAVKSLSEILDMVLDENLLSWFQWKRTPQGVASDEIVFDKGLCDQLTHAYQEEYNLHDIQQLLGGEPDWHYGQVKRVNSSGLYVSRQVFLEFVFPDQDEHYYKNSENSIQNTRDENIS